MLALSRKKGQSIIIGDMIEVMVLGVSGDLVKLGISAPRSISVHRKEVYDQIQEENQKAIVYNNESVDALKNMIQRPAPPSSSV